MFVEWNGKDWLGSGAPGSRGRLLRLVVDGGNLWLLGVDGLLWRQGAKGWEPTPTGTKETIWSVASYGGDTWVARGESPIPVRLPPLPAKP